MANKQLRRKFNFQNGINGSNRYFYPHRHVRTELNGGRFIDVNNSDITNDIIAENMYSDADPYGSYTGVTRNMYERPTQDADDL